MATIKGGGVALTWGQEVAARALERIKKGHTMSNKVNFRARTLDASKPMQVHMAENLPDLQDLNSINRAVPALPTGMEKEEETEKHLQDILSAQIKGLVGEVSTMVIPTPESVSTEIPTASLYLQEFKQPRQYIHVQPFGPSQDLPDYDMDEEDTKFFEEELKDRRKLEVSKLTFEDMLDRLEKNSSQNVVTLKEARLILKEDDDLILVVYDYWLNKRLEAGSNLMPRLKTQGMTSTGGQSPYVAFRRRTEKMQTRRNMKNVEASYEAMLKLRRDLSRAVTMLEMVKRREKTKKEKLNLTLDVFDKRYQMNDWDGKALEYANQVKPKTANTFNIQSWMSLASPPAKRTYRRRKRLRSVSGRPEKALLLDRALQHSSEDEQVQVNSEEEAEENPFMFRRREGVQYHAPEPWDLGNNNSIKPEGAEVGPYVLTAVGGRCVGYCRRRVGRGGRVMVDRIASSWDSEWQGGGDEWDWSGDSEVVRPMTPPALEDLDWDPYMVRGHEVQPSPSPLTPTTLKTVDMNKAGAHNAARALVNSQFVGWWVSGSYYYMSSSSDLFSTTGQT